MALSLPVTTFQAGIPFAVAVTGAEDRSGVTVLSSDTSPLTTRPLYTVDRLGFVNQHGWLLTGSFRTSGNPTLTLVEYPFQGVPQVSTVTVTVQSGAVAPAVALATFPYVAGGTFHAFVNDVPSTSRVSPTASDGTSVTARDAFVYDAGQRVYVGTVLTGTTRLGTPTIALNVVDRLGQGAAYSGLTLGGGAPPSTTLGVLTLVGTLTQGTAASGVTITGATAGSAISLNIAGLTVGGSGTTRTVSGTPGAAGSLTATETLAGATNSPRATTLGTVASAGQQVGGLVPTAAPSGVTFAAQWHPHSAANLKDGGSAAAVGDPVTSSAERNALAAIANPDASLAPLLAQDASGRRYLNFQSQRYAIVDGTTSSGLNGMDSQNIAVFFVGRIHKSRTVPLFYPRFQSDGTSANGANLGALRMSAPTGSTAQFPSTGANATNAGSTTTTGDRLDMLVGSNLAVIGMVSRTTGNSGTNLFYNGKVATTGAAVTARTGMIGALIGASPGAGSAITLSQSRGAATTLGFDLYEMIVVKGNVTDAQATAIIAAIRANWTDIATYDRQIVIDGTSIEDGIVVRSASDRVSGVESDQNVAMVLTAPGAMQVPATTKVVNLAVSGGTVATLTTKRDGGTTSPFITPYDFRIGTDPTKNIVATAVARNDSSAGITSAQHYENVKGLHHTGDGKGYLERGWNAVPMEPLAGSASYMTDFLNDYRARLNGTIGNGIVADLTALNAAYAGRVTLLRPSLITVGGVAIFGDGTAANNLTYYQQSSTGSGSDTTHPNAVGTARYADGGDTPQYGLRKVAT